MLSIKKYGMRGLTVKMRAFLFVWISPWKKKFSGIKSLNMNTKPDMEVSKNLSFYNDFGNNCGPLSNLCHVVYATKGFSEQSDYAGKIKAAKR